MYIHLNINFLRDKVGMRQSDLAERLGKTPTMISSYEKKKSLPPLDVVLEMCSIFEVGLEDFVFKNIKEEGFTPTEKKEDVKDEMTRMQKMIDLMEFKINLYEKEIKEKLPEVAKELKIK